VPGFERRGGNTLASAAVSGLVLSVILDPSTSCHVHRQLRDVLSMKRTLCAAVQLL
jgi:hypothetical protein